MKRYNWGANYVRLDDPTLKVIPPIFTKVLCVRDMSRTIGYEDCGGEVVSFAQYAAMKANGHVVEGLRIKTEQRCVFTLDEYKGSQSSWVHVGSGFYRGFYRLPPVEKNLWKSQGKIEMSRLYLIILNSPSTISSCGLDITMPGVYLAQPYKDELGLSNWAVHQHGFRYKSSNQYAVKPRDLKVPSVSIDYWTPLPDLLNKHSFQ